MKRSLLWNSKASSTQMKEDSRDYVYDYEKDEYTDELVDTDKGFKYQGARR